MLFRSPLLITPGSEQVRATIEDGEADPDTVANLDDRGTVLLNIRRQSGTNSVEVVDAIKERLEEVKATLPPGYEVRVVRDVSDFIKASIHSVEEHLVVGSILAAPSVNAQARKLRLLYVTQSLGFRHQSLHLSESIMEQLGAKNGFEVTLTQMAELKLTPANIKNYDVIVFYTTGELPLSAEQKTLLLNWIKGGKFFIQDGHNKHYPPQTKGTVLVFPSFLMHGVEDIEEGERCSVVCWMVGKFFK